MRKIFRWTLLSFLLGVVLAGARVQAQECSSNDDCGSGQACLFPVGSCGEDGQAGECRTVGGVCCPDIYQPVCGCNGITYSNSCYAYAAGISIRYEDECDGRAQSTEQEEGDPVSTY